MKVTYLGHSGFMVETESDILIFDCIAREKESVSASFIERGAMPDIPEEKRLLVFVSHSHGDHYSGRIFGLGEKRRNSFYFLSSDIERSQVERELPEGFFGKLLFLEPDSIYMPDGKMRIETFLSTDEGLAFYLTMEDGTSIFHAGDLLLWLWDENSDEENEFMNRTFYRALDKLRGRKTDIAFLPLDPRLEGKSALSIDEYLKAMDVKFALPMHFWCDYAALKEYDDSKEKETYRKPVRLIEYLGQCFEV